VTDTLLALARRIRDELSALERIIQRGQEAWRRAKQSPDDIYVDSVALNLHGFYAGVERLFSLVAGVVDGTRPRGSDWHREVLQQMAAEVPGVRPAVISSRTHSALDDYRAFRHLVRNVYTFQLDPLRVGQLIQRAPELLSQLSRELLAFADFLEQRGRADE
jgi:hypothetical protein